MKTTSFQDHRYGGRRRRRGFALMEVTLGLAGLVVLSMMLLKSSINVTTAQQWTVMQGMTDAYMMRETALARRVPFEDITDIGSGWPAYPSVDTQVVLIGRLPGGVPVEGTITRTRIADANNFALAGGTGTIDTNPAKMESHQLQSVLNYKIGGRPYAKSRTVLRTR